MENAIRVTSGTVAIYPTTERKGRAKAVQIVLRPGSLELHKNLKDYKNKKAPKHFFELTELFNVSLQEEPMQIKEPCICLMTADITYFLLPNDPDSTLTDWFELLIEKVRDARSSKLKRPVFREEFFEAAWDVVVIKKPKLRKDHTRNEKIDDLAERLADIQGRKRLCVANASFLIFKMNCYPTADSDQPFDNESYVEMPVNVISSYGKQEKFFFIRMGRCSEFGGGELWMTTEGGTTVTSMHDRISAINQKNAERRRTQGVVLTYAGISSRVLKSKQLRERAQQNKHRESQAALEARARTDTMTTMSTDNSLPIESPIDPVSPSEPFVVPGLHAVKTLPAVKTFPAVKALHAASPPAITKDEQPKEPRVSKIMDMAIKLGNRFHYGSSSNSGNSVFTANPEFNENFDSTEALDDDEPTPPPPQPPEQPQRTLSPRLYKNVAEDYMSYDAHVDSRKASTVYSTVPIRQISIMSNTDSVNNMASITASIALVENAEAMLPPPIPNSDYTLMNSGGDVSADALMMQNMTEMKEARTYMSDMSDSQESFQSVAPKRLKRNSAGDDSDSRNLRAFSLGSKPPIQPKPLAVAPVNGPIEEDTDEDDGRKRTYSADGKLFSITAQQKIFESFAELRARAEAESKLLLEQSKEETTGDIKSKTKNALPTPKETVVSRSRNANSGPQLSSPLLTTLEGIVTRHGGVVESAADKLAALKMDACGKSDREYRRANAPAFGESEYVAVSSAGRGKLKSKQHRIINTIMESSSSEELAPDQFVYGSDDDGCMEYRRFCYHQPLPRTPVTVETSVNNAGLEYALILPNSAPTLYMASQEDSGSMPQPVPTFFPSVSVPWQTSLDSTASDTCDYTIVHPKAQKKH